MPIRPKQPSESGLSGYAPISTHTPKKAAPAYSQVTLCTPQDVSQLLHTTVWWMRWLLSLGGRGSPVAAVQCFALHEGHCHDSSRRRILNTLTMPRCFPHHTTLLPPLLPLLPFPYASLTAAFVCAPQKHMNSTRTGLFAGRPAQYKQIWVVGVG